jgi:NDP-sugar pyrophosphorylase family protein
MTFRPSDFLDLDQTEHLPLFAKVENVWEALAQISTYLQFRLKPAVLGRLVGRPFISQAVFVGEGTIVEQGAFLQGPAWIGRNCHIRNGCYIRENVILGDGVVAGNSCEFKNSILFNGCEVPHFNYVGDSILGFKAHLGAGVILSNVKLDKSNVSVRTDDTTLDTGLRKFGAVIGDRAQVGCNSVINPGSLIGRDTILYPGCQFRGILPARSVVKVVQTHQVTERR